MAGASERVFAAQPLAYAGQRVIASPFQFATSEDDNLRISSANSLVGVTLTIQGRRLTPAGNIEPFSHTHTPNTDRSVKTQDYKLGAGAVLNLTIFASLGAPRIGQTFVSARFIRGISGATLVLGTLLQGYVTAAQHLAYPGSPIQSSIEGGGYVRSLNGTAPGAGNEISETVPTGAQWELLSVWINLQASATVAARRVAFVGNFASAKAMEALAPMDQLASTRWFYTFGAGLVALSDGVYFRATAPLVTPLLLQNSASFGTQTNNIQANDVWDTPRFVVREWLQVDA